jgi:O-antigen ligase
MPRRLLIFLFLALTWGGAMAMSGILANPVDVKAPLMAVGMAGLALLYLPRLRPSPVLIPFLVLWTYGYFRLSRDTVFQEAAVLQVGVLLAFLLGFLRVPMAHRWLLPPLILLCVIRGLMDLITLSHLGTGSAAAMPPAYEAALAYHATSFFGDKHLFGSILVLGAFLHFYLMEKGDPHKPVQVLLYTSSLLVLLTILLIDSRLVQGVFFLCFLPVLFLSVKLDGREPRLERLAWITGITLSLGLAWINLPEMQLHKMATALSPKAPGFLPWAWSSAWHTFAASPWFGTGLGGFRFAVVPHEGIWPTHDASGGLPSLIHAHNHFLETLAEGGAPALLLELAILAGAFFAFARAYYREWRLEAKYAFFALAALVLLGGFCPVLELAPARFIYWMLIGYGWSFLATGLSARRFTFTAKALTGGALAALACLHLYLRVPELMSERLYAKAIPMAESDSRRYTDLLAEALRLNPLNEEANYGYVGVLAGFGRETDAVNLVQYIQKFAPDSKKRDDALARVYATMDRYDSSAKYANRILAWCPSHLPALEILMDAYVHQRRCGAVDSLRAATAAIDGFFPMPPSQDFTITGLDSLFRSNREVLFLQRWFGGKALRKRFVERRIHSYNQNLQNHTRLRDLKEAQCRGGDSLETREAPQQPARGKRPRFLFRGWG